MPRAKGVIITVRLFPEIHGAVLEELARVPCGSRSARVIHLLTIGLIYERAFGNGRRNGAPESPSTEATTMASDAVGTRGEDLAFVSALMESAEG